MKKIKITRKRFVYITLLIIVILYVSYMIINSQTHVRSNHLVVVGFGLDIGLSFIFLIRAASAHAFSFDFMFWLFNFFFLGVAPLLQYFTNIYAWGLNPTEYEITQTNFYVFLWMISYIVGHGLLRLKRVRIKKHRRRNYVYTINRRKLLWLLGASGIITLYYLITVGFSGLVFRENSRNMISLGKTMTLITTHVFRDTVMFSTALLIYDAKRKGKLGIIHILQFIFCVISCFPTGIPRNMMATIYGGLILLALPDAKNKTWISLLLIAGLVLVFPAINIFRKLTTISGVNIGQAVTESIASTYLSGDYDAHQMFISVQQYVQRYGFSYGYQLLGALLFFIPRSIWPSKPYGTGQTAFEALGQHWFTNVSSPLVSEAYVNFGVIGILLVGIFLGYAIKQYDKKYWSQKGLSKISLLYPFVMFEFFFMCRGDLLSSFSYLVAQVVVGSVVFHGVTDKHRVEGVHRK